MRLAGSLFASLAILVPIAAWSQTLANDKENHADDVVVIGRVTDESSEPLPQKPGYVLLGSSWTYRIHVVHVKQGRLASKDIVAKMISDPMLLKNTNILFHLSRNDDGTYQVNSVGSGK